MNSLTIGLRRIFDPLARSLVWSSAWLVRHIEDRRELLSGSLAAVESAIARRTGANSIQQSSSSVNFLITTLFVSALRFSRFVKTPADLVNILRRVGRIRT